MKWFCVLILCLIAPAVLGQPAQVSRVLRKIDFEERRLGNDEDLPMHWTKVEATGFPHYVNGRLTKDQAHGGEYSFRFDLDGGSLLYRYDAHQIPVQTGATYVIEGYVQTTPMKYARARISAYFIDIDGHPLPKTVTHSETYAAANDNDPWKQLTLRLTSHDPSAAYLVLELGLLQPQVYAGETLGDRTVHAQDIHGTAWFDDITISQVPEVVISTDKPGNLFHFSDPMAVMMNIDDAFMADLQVQMFIHDADGRLVYQRSNGMESLETRSIAANHKLAILPVPAVPPGWYEISLLTSSQGRALSTQSVDIVRLPDDQRDTPLDKHFGLIATDLPYSAWNQLPDLVSELGCGRIKLGLWSSNTDPQHMDSAALNDMINRFTDLHITPTACLLDLPPALSNEMDQSSGATPAAGANRAGMSWLRLLHSPDDSWQPPLEYLIARHADHVDRWQIGADGSDIFATQPGMRQVYAKLQSKFNGLITHADVAMPWPAWAEFDGQPPSSSLAMAIPSSVLPSELPLYVQDLKPGKDRRVSLSFQMLDRARYGRDVQLRDLAERVIYALSAGVDRIDLPSPFTAMDTESSAMQPLDLFVPMRSMLSMLSQARYLGKVPIAEGIEAFLFDRHGQGMVALWDTGRTGGVKPLAINLGDQPRLFTLWGSEIPLVRPADDPVSGAVQLSVGPTPEFLLNIDASLAQLRASVNFDRPLIESTYSAHVRHIRFTNTYPTGISGSLRLTPPPGWRITPSVQNFSLNPGETLDREVDIEFPFNCPAGNKTILAQFNIQGDRNRTLQMPLAVKLGLSEIGMQTVAVRDGADVMVQQIIQNYGDKPVDYTAFALMPGQQRQERLITGLQPGRSVVKRFRFIGVIINPDVKIRVGVKEMDGPRILNDEVSVD